MKLADQVQLQRAHSLWQGGGGEIQTLGLTLTKFRVCYICSTQVQSQIKIKHKKSKRLKNPKKFENVNK